MFSEGKLSEEEIKIQNFLWLPSQNKIEDDELLTEVKALLKYMTENPKGFFQMLLSHEFLSSNLLFTDLANKIRKTKQKLLVENYELFFKNNSVELIKLCIVTIWDFERLADAVPSHLDLLFNSITQNFKNEILNEVTVTEQMKKAFPEYNFDNSSDNNMVL